ncbi:MAG: hypothetical protein ACI85O_001817 [Saprospiraceae bacterium]|jgi:hypothetical protein
MDENKIILDYIDKYHAGEVLEEDFQKRLKSDSNLQQAFVQYQQDLKVIRAGVKEQLKRKAVLTLEIHEQKKGKLFPFKRLLQIAAAIALLVVFIFLIKNINQTSSTTDLFAAHFELPDAAGERNSSAQSEAWNDAMVAYLNQDFEKTIDLLAPLVNQADFPFANRGHLYLGLSQLMQNENQKAVKHFEAINSESSFVQDAEWYLALAYLKIDDLEKTKKAFQKIVNQTRHFKQKEAKIILESLR